MSKNKDITYISAPTENIQARYVNAWLKEHNRYKMGRNVAIVLSDENLLQSVIHSLPEEVEKRQYHDRLSFAANTFLQSHPAAHPVAGR